MALIETGINSELFIQYAISGSLGHI